MADTKISGLSAKTTLHDTDLVPIVDVEATPDQTKKITGANLKSQVLASTTFTSHHDRHDPEDGADALDAAAASEIAGVQAAAEGSAHEFARADHAHQIQHGITDNHLVTVDQADAATGEYAKFTANGIESKSKAEQLSDLNVADGADVTGSNAPQAHTASHAVSGADTVFPADPAADKFLMWDDDPGELVWATPAGAGDVTGPASSTDNEIARQHSTTGKILQTYTSNPPTISDTGDVNIDGDLDVENIVVSGDVDGVDVSAHDANTTTAHGAVSTATASKIVVRDASARAAFAAPSAAGDAAILSTVTTHAALTTGTHGVGAGTIWHGGLTNIVDKTHLSQDFGASAGRLRNPIVAPVAGSLLRIIGCGESPFDGVINGNPTATSVVYDGDSKETMFTGLSGYDGSTYWGQIILHNTTRGNSRKIASVNVATNTITTTSSTDDWADDDVITCQSTTNTQAGFFDVDVSAQIAATTEAILMFAVIDDTEGNQDNSRYIMFHPYESYNSGKRQWINANLANIKGQGVYPIKLASQKFTMWMASGCVTINIVLSVVAELEYADT